MAVKLAPVFQEATLDTNGNPWSNAKLFTYVAGSSTKQTTYKDSAAGTPHTNPIILNARGEPPAPIWITSGVTYKFALASPTESDPPASPTRTVDNISGVNDTTVTQDQWVTGAAPTYVSATSFTLVGDQTSTYHVGRRLKTTNSGGTVYSTISVSAFGALTTITVVNDSGTLDAGLSAVSYGLLSYTNPALPAGLAFPATQVPSSNVNTLDDYEEGTWTPGLTFDAAAGITYGTRSGTYTKVGNLVTAIFTLTLTSKGSSTGPAYVTGLPFTVKADTQNSVSMVMFNAMTTSYIAINITPVVSTTTASLQANTAAGTSNIAAVLDTGFSNTSFINATLIYRTS